MKAFLFAAAVLVAFLAAPAASPQESASPLPQGPGGPPPQNPGGPPPKPFARAEMSSPSVEVPMLAGDGVLVEVRIDGKGPYRFLLDTGAAGGGRIAPALAESLGLQAAGRVFAADPSGKGRQEIKIVAAATLGMGGITFYGVRLGARDLPVRQEGGQPEFQGILGIGLFQDHLLTLDYPTRKVRIETGELPPADGREVLAYEDRRGVP